jgi:hypothetical protein
VSLGEQFLTFQTQEFLSPEDEGKTMEKLMKAAQIMRLTVNMQKTKCMEVTKRPADSKMLIINDQQ